MRRLYSLCTYKAYQTLLGYKTQKYSMCITSKKLVTDLHNLGLLPGKKTSREFPSIEQVSFELIPHFVRGYFDGDGSIFDTSSKTKSNAAVFIRTRPKISLCGNLKFLSTINNLIDNICRIRKEKRTLTDIWYMETDTYSKVHAFYTLLYKDATIYLQRKKDKFHDLFEKRGSTTIIGTPTRGLYQRGVRDSLVLYENIS